LSVPCIQTNELNFSSQFQTTFSILAIQVCGYLAKKTSFQILSWLKGIPDYQTSSRPEFLTAPNFRVLLQVGVLEQNTTKLDGLALLLTDPPPTSFTTLSTRKVHPFSKIDVTLEPVMRLAILLGLQSPKKL
jgi:hypothetical protein